MSTDDRVKSATAHWGPRFVANGVSLTDFEEVTASISNWDDWCQAWSDRALVHEELGEDAHNRKKFLTAGEHLQRAGIYYHFASFLFVHDIPQMRIAHFKGVGCRTRALPYLLPAGERVEMPYEGKWLAGIRVVGTDLRPCGFGRALLRNVLKIADSFFNFMVGIVLVTFTKDWQRVGDMLARTIVIRKAEAQRYAGPNSFGR